MKKVIMFLAVAMFLISCGGAGVEPTDNITWGQAFNHCIGAASYLVFLIVSIAVLGYVTYLSIKKYRGGSIDGMGITWRVLLAVVVFAFCLFMRPSEVAANTTVEQASRGVYIW